MAKRPTVFEFLCTFASDSEDIPVKVMCGLDLVCAGKSLDWLSAHGLPGVLDRKIKAVTLTRDEIVIQVKAMEVKFKL